MLNSRLIISQCLNPFAAVISKGVDVTQQLPQKDRVTEGSDVGHVTVVTFDGKDCKTTSFEGKSFCFLRSRGAISQQNQPNPWPFVSCWCDTCVFCHCIIHVYIWLTDTPWGLLIFCVAADMPACCGVSGQYVRIDEATISQNYAAFAGW